MPLDGRPFAETFVFARGRIAPYRDASGALINAGVNVPRVDHLVDGTPRGLLIEAGARFGDADLISAAASTWDSVGADPDGKATVLHQYELASGEIRSLAFYTQNARAMVDGCLRAAVRHKIIAALPGHMPPRGNFIRFRGVSWYLPSAFAAGPGFALADQDGRILIEG